MCTGRPPHRGTIVTFDVDLHSISRWLFARVCQVSDLCQGEPAESTISASILVNRFDRWKVMQQKRQGRLTLKFQSVEPAFVRPNGSECGVTTSFLGNRWRVVLLAAPVVAARRRARHDVGGTVPQMTASGLLLSIPYCTCPLRNRQKR